jgi:hypothetical protein
LDEIEAPVACVRIVSVAAGWIVIVCATTTRNQNHMFGTAFGK